MLRNLVTSLSVRPEAKTLEENLCKFGTILVAFVYVRIFDITAPVSDYLQTSGLDLRGEHGEWWQRREREIKMYFNRL